MESRSGRPDHEGLVDLAADLAARGIGLRSLTDGIDTGTHTGRLLFHILGSIAEMERELIRANHGETGGAPEDRLANRLSFYTVPVRGVCIR